jgi:hypothetical protein
VIDCRAMRTIISDAGGTVVNRWNRRVYALLIGCGKGATAAKRKVMGPLRMPHP